MSTQRKKESRPKANPVPVRFSDETLREIDAVSGAMGMSRQDVIRLSVSAGLKALRKIGINGIIDRIADELIHPGSTGDAPVQPPISKADKNENE